MVMIVDDELDLLIPKGSGKGDHQQENVEKFN